MVFQTRPILRSHPRWAVRLASRVVIAVAATLFWCGPEAIAAMKAEGATHVMVHLERFGAEAPDVEQSLLGRDDLQMVASDGAGHRLYRFRQ